MISKWNVECLNIAVLATDGKSFRRIAWIKTNPNGIYCVIASNTGIGSKLSYHSDGNLYSGMYGIKTPRSVLKYPAIRDIKGFQPFYGSGLGWGDYFREFPFDRVDEAVYVDVRGKKGVSFNLGFLEPHAFQFLNMKNYHNPHIHIMARTNPWIVIWTYGERPKLQPSWMSSKKIHPCKTCKNPLDITREPEDQNKMQHAHCDLCGYNITTEICQKCGKGIVVQLYDRKDPNSKEEPKRIVTSEECRDVDGFSKGCGWKNEVKRF